MYIFIFHFLFIVILSFTSYTINQGNIIELCKNVELVIDLIENKEEEYLFKAKTSRKFILENYSIEEQERTIVDAWNDILTRA